MTTRVLGQFAMDLFECVQAVGVGHADVQQHDVRLVLGRHLYRFVATGRLGHNFNLRAGEHARQTGTNDLVIVGN